MHSVHTGMTRVMRFVVAGFSSLGVGWVSAADGTPSVTFEIDGSQQWPISPCIYGTNQPDWQAMELT